MKFKYFIITIIAIGFAYFPYWYINWRIDKAKFEAIQLGTYNWLLEMYRLLYRNQNVPSPDSIPTLDNINLMNFFKVAETKSETKWAASIMVKAYNHGLTFRQQLIDDLIWMEIDKYGYQKFGVKYPTEEGQNPSEGTNNLFEGETNLNPLPLPYVSKINNVPVSSSDSFIIEI